MIKKNIIANYLGQGWVALMTVAFVPIYIRFLGAEAYGLIGLFALLQAWMSLLDMGMTPTLGREMARFTGGSHSAQSIRDLLRSIEIVALGVATLAAAAIALCANWIATYWVRVEALPIELVSQAFQLMGLVISARLFEGVYRSSIVGLQRQILFNVVNSVMATVRWLGAVGVLIWVSASIQAFFIWQAVVSIATVSILAVTTYASLPPAQRAGRFSMQALRDVWKFAGGMIGISFLGLLLTQVDKILLSKLLTLSEYGYYTLAALVASALNVVISPITQAFYPRFCELHARNDQVALADSFHKSAQLVSVFAGSVAIVGIMFAEELLRLWTQNPELAQRTSALLSLLMLGNLLNGLMWIPYQTQLAHGWTSLAVRTNIIAVAVIVPAIVWATPRFGAEGAAWAWVALNAGYCLISVHFMYRRILRGEKWRWYLQDVFIPLLAGAAAASIVALLWSVESSNIADFTLLALAAIVTLGTTLISASIPRHQLWVLVRSRFAKW